MRMNPVIRLTSVATAIPQDRDTTAASVSSGLPGASWRGTLGIARGGRRRRPVVAVRGACGASAAARAVDPGRPSIAGVEAAGRAHRRRRRMGLRGVQRVGSPVRIGRSRSARSG